MRSVKHQIGPNSCAANLPGDAPCIIKVIFAETELHAEDLLNQIRAAGSESPG